MIKLGKDQEKAFELIKEFLQSEELVFSLIGSAGTGKTYLIKTIINHLENFGKNYVLCAPTHKAKVVLERFSEREGMTLHKLLALAPNLEILHLDFKDLKFLMKSSQSLFPFGGIVICDESSMINDEMFDLLIEKCESCGSKIIFVGDLCQIKPVNGLSVSKVFNCENKFELLEIFRQQNDSGLVDVLPILRNRLIERFETIEGNTGSIYCYDDVKTFLQKSLPYFKKAIKNQDIMECKILAYTNARVDAFNDKIKETLFGKENQYNKFEFITGCENFEYNKTKFWNSMDYVIVEEPEKIELSIPNFIKLPAYKLQVYDASNKITLEVDILDKEIDSQYFNSLAYTIETLRVNALNAKNRRYSNSGKLWGEYYNIIKSFASPIDLNYDNRLIKKKSFSSGYACSIHKSQGSSINNVFIDMKNVLLCRDVEEKRQLQYVALSRTKNNVYIFQ